MKKESFAICFFSLPFERSSKKNIYEEYFRVREDFFFRAPLCDYHLLDINFLFCILLAGLEMISQSLPFHTTNISLVSDRDAVNSISGETVPVLMHVWYHPQTTAFDG